MLKSIIVENFRSVDAPIMLELGKAKNLKAVLPHYFVQGHLLLSASSVIYGANASGKSNLLKAFRAMEYLVLNSAKFQPNEAIPPYEPFKLRAGSSEKPVGIEMDFYHANIRYTYAIRFVEKHFVSEKLEYFPRGNKPSLLFNRLHGEAIKFGDDFKGEKRIIEKMLLPNQLFLSKAAENNAESVQAVFAFFSERLLVFPYLNQGRETKLESFYAKRLAEAPDAPFAQKLNALICALDTGINGIRAKETDWNQVQFPESMPENARKQIQEEYQYEIKTTHAFFDAQNQPTGKIDFDIDDESMGTRSLLAVGGIILDALEKGAVLVVDEFEKNLHPIITSYLIRLFHHPVFNPKQAQLIFATHDVTQLTEEAFNRDQVWFAQKNTFGVTELVRCSEIKGLRLKAPLDKWYITGRLGGTAIINDTEFIMAMQSDGEQ